MTNLSNWQHSKKTTSDLRCEGLSNFNKIYIEWNHLIYTLQLDMTTYQIIHFLLYIIAGQATLGVYNI